MKKLEFSIKISAPREKVWDILWDDATFRDWASLIDEGTYIKGELSEGNEIQFLSSVNGYGVTSLVEKYIENEYIQFKHEADTQRSGKITREKEWAGGSESYSLTENNDITTLVVKMDTPQNQEENFNIRIPKVLKRIKELAEA